MSYKDIINSLVKYNYSQYKDISSCEKLMVYAAYILNKKNVPLTFNYLCIAAFKLFPEKFCVDEEFKEFPSVDRLNRTYMHLKYVQNGKSYIVGTTSDGFKLTVYGESVAEEVEAIINNSEIDMNVFVPPVDQHKKGISRDYSKFKESEGFINYNTTGKIDVMYVFNFYNVTPYTRMKMINKNLEDILVYAKENKDEELVKYVNGIIDIIKQYL